MGITTSSYYYRTTSSTERRIADLNLRDDIERIQKSFPGYGWRRIQREFLNQGQVINHKKLKRIMQEFELRSVHRKAYKVPYERADYDFPNLTRGLTLTGINQLWATDITRIRLRFDILFLAAIIDVYSRRIVGWAISKSMDHKVCLEAFKSAVRKRRPKAGCIHHSDHGSQYGSEVYVKELKEKGFKISMSAKACPIENAYIESFFKTLKHEEVKVKKYKTVKEAVKNVGKFIDIVYNEKRMHSSLDYESPLEFEMKIERLNDKEKPVQKLAFGESKK